MQNVYNWLVLQDILYYIIMTTKEGINKSLKLIGYNGLAGTVLSVRKSTDAFTLLLAHEINNQNTLKRVCSELVRQKLVQVDKEQAGTRITITPAGATRLLSINANEVKLTPMKQWDKRWRLVCFDIPSGKDSQRQYFNRRLHELGFTMIQKSMWVHPYECIDAIRHITDYIGLTRYVSVLEVTKLDERTTKHLLAIFKLELDL